MDMKGENEQDKVIMGRIKFPDNPPLPFPQRFRKTKLDEQFAKFLNIFKKLEVNMLFVDAFTQMANYVKFIKEIMSNKKKVDAYGTVSLFENCSAIIQKKLP